MMAVPLIHTYVMFLSSLHISKATVSRENGKYASDRTLDYDVKLRILSFPGPSDQ